MKILQINGEMFFFRFLSAAATQTGKLINYAEITKETENINYIPVWMI